MPIAAIVLAAGEGTRMKSTRPKPLHLICGRPMVLHVIHALVELDIERTVVVVGHAAERVTKKVQEQAPDWANVSFVEQRVQHGTGDATIVGLASFANDDIDDTSTVLVLPGDTPLLRPETISALVSAHEQSGNAATLLSTVVSDPSGYGRIVRGRNGRIVRIVEQKDATLEEEAITEINTSIYAFRRDLLGPALRGISNNNSQAEYYLTDVIEGLAAMGHPIGSLQATPHETAGVNDRWQLSLAEAELRARINKNWLLHGVTMLDSQHTFIDVTVTIGRDVTLYPGTILQGDTTIGEGSEIGPNTRLSDCVVGSGSIVQNTVGRESEIGTDAVVGPFASLPPGSSVSNGQHTGAFYTGQP